MVDENSNQKNNNDEDEELKLLRMKRMQKVLSMKQQQEKIKQYQDNQPTLEDKIHNILRVICAPNAYQYLMQIKEKNQNTYERILYSILPPHLMQEIDTLMMYLSRGMLRQGVITLIDIKYLERQILGIGPQITVKKSGEESKSLGDFLKED